MIAQAQIVVSAEVEYFFSAHLNSSSLRAFDETFSLVEASVLKGSAKTFADVLEVYRT